MYLDANGVFITTNVTRQAYKASNRWYTLSNSFPENSPQEPKSSRMQFGRPTDGIPWKSEFASSSYKIDILYQNKLPKLALTAEASFER